MDFVFVFSQYLLVSTVKYSTDSRSLPPAGTRISTFTQADLASRSIQYIHTSEEEKHADQFSFSVSDGTNEVNKSHSITVILKCFEGAFFIQDVSSVCRTINETLRQFYD